MKIFRALPNTLSLLRLALLPPYIGFFVDNPENLAPLALALAIGATDLADGFFARRWNLESRFGGILDSVGDNAFIAISLLLFALNRPIFLLLLIPKILLGIGLLVHRKTWNVNHMASDKLLGVSYYAIIVTELLRAGYWVDLPANAFTLILAALSVAIFGSAYRSLQTRLPQ